MTYFRVDDDLWGHPKFALLSNDAIALWTLAGSWCGRYETEGFVPFQTLPMLRGSKQAAQELVDVGLWHVAPDGYLFHEWTQHNYTKDQLEHRRKLEREKKARWRAKSTSVSTSMSTVDSLGGPPGSPGIGISSSSSKNYEALFDEFWKAYPKGHHGSKAAAKKNFIKAVADGVDPQAIIAGARAYARFLASQENPPKTKYPQGWLTERRWEVGYVPQQPAQVTALGFNDSGPAPWDTPKPQEPFRSPGTSGGISDTGEPFRALSVAPSGNHDDSWLESS